MTTVIEETTGTVDDDLTMIMPAVARQDTDDTAADARIATQTIVEQPPAVQWRIEANKATGVLALTVESAPPVAVPMLQFPNFYIILYIPEYGIEPACYRAFNLEFVGARYFDVWLEGVVQQQGVEIPPLDEMREGINRALWPLDDKWWVLNYLAARGVCLPLYEGEDAAERALARLEEAARAKEGADEQAV